MAITCPTCQAEIPVEDVNVAAGVALCRGCANVCRLADLAGAAAPATTHQRTERPAGTKIELAEAGERLIVAMPRGAARPLGFFLLLFGGIWDLVSGIILVSIFTGMSGHGGPEGPAIGQAFDWFGLLFVGLFFVVGLAIMIGGIYVLSVRVALSIDREAVTLVRSAFGREWASTRPTGTATGVRRVERYKQNNVAKYGVGIAFTGASDLVVGAGLDEAELSWLGGEIAHALRRCGANLT